MYSKYVKYSIEYIAPDMALTHLGKDANLVANN